MSMKEVKQSFMKKYVYKKRTALGFLHKAGIFKETQGTGVLLPLTVTRN